MNKNSDLLLENYGIWYFGNKIRINDIPKISVLKIIINNKNFKIKLQDFLLFLRKFLSILF